MDDIQHKIIEYCKMLDAIRARKKTDFNVETLKSAIGVSRTTADRLVNELLCAGLIEKSAKRYTIKGSAAFFLGISIGSMHTRLQLLDLNFEALSRDQIRQYPCLAGVETFGDFEEDESGTNGLSFRTPYRASGNTFSLVRNLISKIIAAFLEQVEQSQTDPNKLYFPLCGIGVAVTGPVDYTERVWCSAPRNLTEIQNISLPELIGYDNFRKAENLGIFFSFDNNAKTAIISEYQYLLEQNKGKFDEDIALLYIGSGIGSAAVIGKKLLRGSHNLSGELGYLPTLPACAEDESGSLGLSEVQETVDERVRLVESCNIDEDTKLKHYFCVFSYLFSVINCVLGIDRVILVGHSIKQYKNIIPALLENRMEYTIGSTQHYCKPGGGRDESGTAAIGAAIEAYMCMCHYDSCATPTDNERINLAKEVSWI